MGWVFGTIIVVVLGLFVWSSYSTSKKVQPFIDDVLDSHPLPKTDATGDEPR
jgi:hypothetical protein